VTDTELGALVGEAFIYGYPLVADVGTRASGNQPGTYFLTPPGFSGAVPDGATRIPFPTRVASILGRWACSGADDLAAVHALQDQLVIRPAGDVTPVEGVQQPTASVSAELAFFDRAKALGDALEAAQAQLEAFTKTGTVQKINGWMMGLHMFDYNLDYFGPGAIDDPQWKKTDRASAYPERALAARVGLWGNHAYEATYAQTFEDDHGEQLTGTRRYTIRFDAMPPVEAFWSLTMYDMPDYYLVDNPINRYSIGDRTPGLHFAADGSLTVHMQHDAPDDPDARANWLPTPAGDFRPILRMYEPRTPIFDGRYQLPPIDRMET
jgi:hypothetical protein